MHPNIKEKLTAAIESKIAVNVQSKGFAPFASARKLAEAIVVEIAQFADNAQIEAARKAAVEASFDMGAHLGPRTGGNLIYKGEVMSKKVNPVIGMLVFNYPQRKWEKIVGEVSPGYVLIERLNDPSHKEVSPVSSLGNCRVYTELPQGGPSECE